jgi:integrase
MPTVAKTESGTWKALVRKVGYPVSIKTFRLKRDAEDWARRTEDEMVRGSFIQRAPSERTIFAAALERYLNEVTPTKRPNTQITEKRRALPLLAYFGKYSLASITPELVAKYRDYRLSGEDRLKDGKPQPRAPNSVRIEMALLGHLFTVAIKEWGIGFASNPMQSVRRPAPGPGRNRRFVNDEEERLKAVIDAHSNPMLKWIVHLAIETGMRSSEIATLKLDQVDIKRQIVLLRETKNTSPRTVPMSKRATETMDMAMKNPVRPKKTSLIFFGEPGKDGKIRPYNFNKVWREKRDAAGLANFHFHDMRHEAVSRFVERGFSDQEVSAISGHKSMQMLKKYTHLRAEDLVSRLDDVKVSQG